MTEYVLAVHRDQFSLQNVGLSGIYGVDLNKIGQVDFSFLPRHIASNKSPQSIMLGSVYPQICGYYQIKNEEGKILTYQRKGKEAGLLGKWSIGIGGHIDITDYIDLKKTKPDGESVKLNELIAHSSIRELEEELGVELVSQNADGSTKHHFEWTKDLTQHFDCVLSLSVDATNIVHLGLPAELQIDTTQISINPNADELINWQWLSKEDLKNNDREFEAWSKLLISHM